MPTIIEVTKGHPLHFMHTFYEMLPLGDVEVTSIWSGYNYLYLQHHGHPEAAIHAISDPQLMWNPDIIFDNVVRGKVSEPNINFVVRSVDVLRSVMFYQLQCTKSPFVEALEKILGQIENPRDVEFHVYSASNEMILSSGMQYKHWKEPIRGFDSYANILYELCDAVLGQHPFENPLFHQVTTDFNLFCPATTKSVLLVTDSQGKFFEHITGGHVVAVGGGNFSHMVKLLDPDNNLSEDLHMDQYKWIIVYCGTNCRAKNRYDYTRREFDWQKLRKILTDEAARCGDNSVLFCNSFEHPFVDVSPGLANQVEQNLQGTGVQCINWKRIGNPFLDPNGMPKIALFDHFKKRSAYQKSTEIHLNHAGLNILWKTFCEFIPELKFIQMKMSSQPLSIPKYLLDEVPELPVVNLPDGRLQSALLSISADGDLRPRSTNTHDGRLQSALLSISADGDLRPRSTNTHDGRLQSARLGISADRDLRRSAKRKSDHMSHRPAHAITGIIDRDGTRSSASTSTFDRRDALAASEVILHRGGDLQVAKRRRRRSETEEDDLRVTCPRSARETSDCRIYYDKRHQFRR